MSEARCEICGEPMPIRTVTLTAAPAGGFSPRTPE